MRELFGLGPRAGTRGPDHRAYQTFMSTPIDELPKHVDQICPTCGGNMTANAMNRGAAAVDRVNQKIEGLANALDKRLDDLGVRAENAFGKVESGVAVPLEKSIASLEDMVNRMTNGGPPLDGGQNA